MAKIHPIFTQEELETELWKPVVGYETYYSVSNLGRIRRDRPGGGSRAGRLLFWTLGPKGRPVVTLTVNAKSKGRLVHILVAQAFLGSCPPGFETDHIDADKTNNRLSNLEYVTPEENRRRAVAKGLYVSGNNHWTQTNPEKLARGDKHGSRLHPERVRRGITHPFVNGNPSARGESNGNAKLTADDVRCIRQRIAKGDRIIDIAADYPVAATVITRIKKGVRWQHIV